MDGEKRGLQPLHPFSKGERQDAEEADEILKKNNLDRGESRFKTPNERTGRHKKDIGQKTKGDAERHAGRGLLFFHTDFYVNSIPNLVDRVREVSYGI